MPAVREEIEAIGWIAKGRSFVRNSEDRMKLYLRMTVLTYL
jgi:hypothetical protein